MTAPAMIAATNLDSADVLRGFRDRFLIPKHSDGSDVTYLCGNSLGLQPKNARAYINEMLDDWERFGVEGHVRGDHPWLRYHELLTEQTARLVGAQPSEVVVMNSLTVNLHLMMVSFFRPTRTRHRIVIERKSFPSDRYAVVSQLHYHGLDPARSLVELTPREGESTLRTGDIVEFLGREGNDVALVMLGGVNYYTGQAFEIEPIARAAHGAGCLIGLDLAHATGNIVLRLHDWNIDFAVWCSYKYLNAGPGSTAGCFVHDRHADRNDIPRFAGWWGHDKENRFLMGPDFHPIPGAEGWQLSNPAILPMAALRASMDIFDEAGMAALRRKSESLTGYLEQELKAVPGGVVEIITPPDPAQRGAQLSLRLRRDGRTIFSELSRRGIVCDWREPDSIRVAPVPLYNSFADAARFVQTLRTLIGEHDDG